MDFETIESRRLRETVLYRRHPTGLDIFVVPKKGYSSQYAIFGTRYGSIDNRFTDAGGRTVVPEGIAHFLEHKLFESEDGDAFSRYARTGASANAYTSFDRTCYLFSCTSQFRESLEILLDFVQSPYFTEQTVRKEQGIIGQEIRMYQDDPGWQVFFGLLGALYHTHPVKIDIAGTEDSISKITADLLYKCYRAFYNLHNMVLCVAGDVEPELVNDVADRLLKSAPAMEVKSEVEPEPETVASRRVEKKLSVSVPLFNIGFKDTPAEGKNLAKKDVITEILLEILGGDASPLYRRLYDRGLINTSFSLQYFIGRSFAASVVGGESREPDTVAEELLKQVETLRRGGIPQADFEAARKSLYGRLATQFDSVDDVANAVAAGRFAGMGPFDMADAAAAATLDDVMERLDSLCLPGRFSMSVVSPV